MYYEISLNEIHATSDSLSIGPYYHSSGSSSINQRLAGTGKDCDPGDLPVLGSAKLRKKHLRYSDFTSAG